MRDPLVDVVAEKVADQGRDVTELTGRVDAIAGSLRKDQAETARQHGLPADLVSAEQNALLRHTPFRNRWPDVAAFDERVASLEIRRPAIADELREFHERAQNAPGVDAQALADWELAGRKGARPEPTRPAIEADIKRRQDELDGLDAAVSRVLVGKREYVIRHRTRLEKEAKQHRAAKHERYVQAIAELEAARQELLAARRAEVWAALFPAEQANQTPPDTLAGARKRVLAPMGATSAVEPGRVLAALREDADWLADSCTPEQRLVIEGRNLRQPPNTQWHDTPEAKAERDKRMAEWANSR